MATNKELEIKEDMEESNIITFGIPFVFTLRIVLLNLVLSTRYQTFS